MAHRATKSGFAAEAHSKVMGKYDADQAHEVMEWIRSLTGEQISTSGDMKNVMEVLHDGMLLCKVGQALGWKPNAAVLKPSNMAFKQMERIGQFLDFVRSMGVPDHEVFATVDLYESQNPNQVITSLQSLARKAKAKGYQGFGPKEATENKREFSEEQLKAGQGIIGLQMGSNKGANQSGQNFGKGRMIVD